MITKKKCRLFLCCLVLAGLLWALVWLGDISGCGSWVGLVAGPGVEWGSGVGTSGVGLLVCWEVSW